jgi:hypothetical protein
MVPTASGWETMYYSMALAAAAAAVVVVVAFQSKDLRYHVHAHAVYQEEILVHHKLLHSVAMFVRSMRTSLM